MVHEELDLVHRTKNAKEKTIILGKSAQDHESEVEGDDTITGKEASLLHSLLESPERDLDRQTFIRDACTQFISNEGQIITEIDMDDDT